MILPKIVYRQGFMLLFLSNENSNETGVFSPFLQKCQKSSIYGAFRTFYILQVLDIADFSGKYFPLSSYMFSYLSKCFNRSKSVCLNRHVGSNPTPSAKRKECISALFLLYTSGILISISLPSSADLIMPSMIAWLITICSLGTGALPPVMIASRNERSFSWKMSGD